MSPDPANTPDPIDIEALMRDLRRRVAEKKARGLYVTDAMARDAMETPGEAGLGEDDLARIQDGAVVRQGLLVGASTRPVIGRFVERAKRFVVRASFDNVADVTAQQTRFNADVAHAVKVLAERLTAISEHGSNVRAREVLALAARQDAEVAGWLARAGDSALLIASPGIGMLESRPDGAAAAVGVLGAAVPEDADGLGMLTSELARVAAPGAMVALAPPVGNAGAIAALLRAVGFASARVERLTDPSDASGLSPGDQIVIAER